AAADGELAAAVERLTAPLAAHAESGIPTPADLRAEFPAVARAVAGFAPVPAGDSGGWRDRLLGRLSDLISLRPVGAGVEGDDPAARVARAEAHLATGDLAAAIDELADLTGERAAAAADWLARARARLAVERALSELQAAAIARLAPADAAATSGGG
ncbi:MAG: mitofilin family membrane protein, partial [Dongiaceae bacterium]